MASLNTCIAAENISEKIPRRWVLSFLCNILIFLYYYKLYNILWTQLLLNENGKLKIARIVLLIIIISIIYITVVSSAYISSRLWRTCWAWWGFSTINFFSYWGSLPLDTIFKCEFEIFIIFHIKESAPPSELYIKKPWNTGAMQILEFTSARILAQQHSEGAQFHVVSLWLKTTIKKDHSTYNIRDIQEER